MSKKYSIFITILFCLFIFGLGIAMLILPDRTFSEQENTTLSQFTPPTAETLLSGEFMEDFEDYVSDQFPAREWWVRLKARCEKWLGKRENNGVYFGTDGATLFAHYTVPGDAALIQRVEYVNTFAEHAGVPVYFSLVPDKSYSWAGLLPEHAPNTDDGSTLKRAEQLCSESLTWIDLSQTLTGEDAYYRTDHHWTTFGAFAAYQALMETMGGGCITPAGTPVPVSAEFYGTTWSSAGAGWIAPDPIHTWVGEDGPITVTRYPNGSPEAGELYDESFLAKKDKYSMFLGGNQPLCVLKNPTAEGGKLLVIRDSYCDTLAPFLAQNYSEVHLIDLRYYKTSLPEYIEEHGIDEALVLYSAANFTTDQNLRLMALG